MAIYALSDAKISAISLVTKGANRKRFFLRKTDSDDAPPVTMPAHHGVIRKAAEVAGGWEAAYVVVAEPEWLEGQGTGPGASADDLDIWASTDEIRKAAHEFVAGGGLINKMHESLEPYGQLVESAIAPVDFAVAQPDGTSETIRKGSWYIAIRPTDEGREAIDRGELTGVSVEGDAMRKLVEKAAGAGNLPPMRPCPTCGMRMKAAATKCPNGHESKPPVAKTAGPPGTDIARNEGKQFGPLRNLIKYYLKFPHPFSKCVEDNRKRFGPATERVCAALKDIGLQTTHWRSGPHGGLSKEAAPAGTVTTATAAGGMKAPSQGGALRFSPKDVPGSLYTQVDHIWRHKHGLTDDHAKVAWKEVRRAHAARTNTSTVNKLLRRIAKASGVSDAELEALEAEDAELVKDDATFADYINGVDIQDELWDGFQALRQAVRNAIDPDNDGDCDISSSAGDDDDAVSPEDAKASIKQSCDEFATWLAGLIDKLPNVTSDVQKSMLAKAFSETSATVTPNATDGDEMALTDDDKTTLAKLFDDKLKPLSEKIEKLEKAGEDEQPPTVEDLHEQLGELTDGLSKISKAVDLLAEGESAQVYADEDPPRRRARQVRKSRGDNDLAGILS